MENDKKTAVVAMSGGVDSSVAALLLLQNGYEVIGITGKMVNLPSAQTVIDNAKNVAEKLGIKHYVLDMTDEFQSKVINYFENSYGSGETPNPCIACNRYIKWGKLFDYALNELGADAFATGHYADIRFVGGLYKLYPAADEHKDQLYFLCRLGQKELSKTVFPLQGYKKADVRALAEEYDLPPKSSKESQDICFIQKPNTAKKYLTEIFGNKKGVFADIQSGKKLGEHDGSYKFTIGQRKGIGISAPEPLYVADINAGENIVYLGKENDIYRTKLIINDLNFSYPPTESEFDAMVKIRYNMKAEKAHVLIEENTARVEFYVPVSSVTKGQAGVLYDINDGHLIAGGFIQ